METLNNLAFFPLALFKMPGETIELHIFENKYRQLVRELLDQEIEYFGIPASFAHGQHGSMGGLARIQKVHRSYPDGRYDIRVEIIDLIEILNFEDRLGEKLYAGGDAKRLHFKATVIESAQLIFLYNELATLYPGVFKKTVDAMSSDLDLLNALPISDLEKLTYAKLPNLGSLRENFLRYQLQRLRVILLQEAAVYKGICFN